MMAATMASASAAAAATSKETTRGPFWGFNDGRDVHAEIPFRVELPTRALVTGEVLEFGSPTHWHLAARHRHGVETEANRHRYFAGDLVPFHVGCESNGKHRIKTISEDILQVHVADT